jgi:hypothetical protein
MFATVAVSGSQVQRRPNHSYHRGSSFAEIATAGKLLPQSLPATSVELAVSSSQSTPPEPPIRQLFAQVLAKVERFGPLTPKLLPSCRHCVVRSLNVLSGGGDNTPGDGGCIAGTLMSVL